MLHSVLSIVLAVAWLLLTVYTLVGFWRILRRRGLRAAFAVFASRQFLVPLALVASLTLVRLSMVFVYPQQMAVVVSLLAADGVREEPLDAGLHWVWPLAEQAVVYPRYWQTYTMSDRAFEGQHPDSDAIRARTKDNQEVMIDVSVIFRLDPAQLVDVHRYWQRRYAEELLRPGVRGFMRDAVSGFTVNEVNSSRRKTLAAQLDQAIKRIASANGLVVEQVLLRNIAFTGEYAGAVERKQVELENEIKARHRARQVEQLARGEASKIKILAEANAEAVEVRARAEAQARLIRAEAEAEALALVAEALQGKQNLLTYRYITKLSPQVQAVVLPNDMPLIFPLPSMQPPAGAAAEAPPPVIEIERR